MALKRKSLAELHSEDKKYLENEGRPFMPPPVSEITNNNSEKRNNKSEFVKMSITVEPELFESVQGLSIERRKNKQEFTFSAIIRDALKVYLGQQG